MSRGPAAGASSALRLHYNENTAGCSPVVLDALRTIGREDAASYPDYGPATARAAAALGVDPDWVQLTNGLDEGLHGAAQWARLAQDAEVNAPRPEAIVVEPAFEMYAACARAAGLRVVPVAPLPDFRFPLDEVRAAITRATRLVYLNDPNNPTGLALPPGAVEAVAKLAPAALVFVDEAYADFSARTSIGPDLATRRNVVVGRTFAKAHGLAALRVGALVAHPETLRGLRDLLPPFSVNVAALRALTAALDDRAYVEQHVRESTASRTRIYEFCRRHGLEFWPSEANFVLVRIGADASAVVERMARQGVLIRDKSPAPGCAGCIRITAGVAAHTERALAALEGILASRTN